MEPSETPEGASLDATVGKILDQFETNFRLDHSQDALRSALRRQLSARNYSDVQKRIIEVNLLGSLSGWMDFVLDERRDGRDVVPDFARYLRRSFLAHCRERSVEPEVAVNMAVELATVLMDVACGFQKHMHIGEDDHLSEEHNQAV